MFETMTKKQIITAVKKHNITSVNPEQLKKMISNVAKRKFAEEIKDLDYHGGVSNIQINTFLFELPVLAEFIQDNPDFNYNKLIAGTHEDIFMSAFFDDHYEMDNIFGYRDDFERRVQNCECDFYLHLFDNGEDELKLIMVVIS